MSFSIRWSDKSHYFAGNPQCAPGTRYNHVSQSLRQYLEAAHVYPGLGALTNLDLVECEAQRGLYLKSAVRLGALATFNL